MDDDCWDSGDDEQDLLHKDWQRVENGLQKNGYREGLERSQEEMMQNGFDKAFKQSMLMAFDAGQLQGGICASVCQHSLQNEQSNLSSETTSASTKLVEDLNNDINSLVSEIPNILNKKGKLCASKCSCDTNSSEADSPKTIHNYWEQLKTIQRTAEKEDKHLDSHFLLYSHGSQ